MVEITEASQCANSKNCGCPGCALGIPKVSFGSSLKRFLISNSYNQCQRPSITTSISARASRTGPNGCTQTKMGSELYS